MSRSRGARQSGETRADDGMRIGAAKKIGCDWISRKMRNRKKTWNAAVWNETMTAVVDVLEIVDRGKKETWYCEATF